MRDRDVATAQSDVQRLVISRRCDLINTEAAIQGRKTERTEDWIEG